MSTQPLVDHVDAIRSYWRDRQRAHRLGEPNQPYGTHVARLNTAAPMDRAKRGRKPNVASQMAQVTATASQVPTETPEGQWLTGNAALKLLASMEPKE